MGVTSSSPIRKTFCYTSPNSYSFSNKTKIQLFGNTLRLNAYHSVNDLLKISHAEKESKISTWISNNIVRLILNF